MITVEELIDACVAAGVDRSIINKGTDKYGRQGIHINCADHQWVFIEDNKVKFSSCGGSRFFHDQAFDDVTSAAEYIKKFSSLTCEEINGIYRKTWQRLQEF